MPQKKYCYPEEEVYRGHIIKSYPSFRIRVSKPEMKKIIDAHIDTGLSYREIIEYSGQPCESCKGTSVLVYNKKDNAVQIKRGILNKRKNNG